MPGKILCPIDFSTSSTQAMRVAVRLAGEYDAALVLAHVWHLPALAFAGADFYPGAIIADAMGGADAALKAAVGEAHKLGARRVTGAFLDGIPWRSLCDLLEGDPEFELVVMGTHGRTGFRRVLLGSVAEKVVRLAPCSVLVVRGRPAAPPCEHLLCCVDFSASSRAALAAAARLADLDGHRLTLLHVIETPAVHGSTLASTVPLAQLEEGAHRLLEEWAASVREQVKVPVVTRIAIGSPVAEILRTVDEAPSIDVVIVGTHGHGPLERLVVGSVAGQVVRHAPCMVMVAREREPAAGGPT